jgi:photosystem II stability/assembly factor-like uncharacterized protein
MIIDRDLDRQLVTWFEGRATSAAPEGLLERSLDRVDATRQRPGWIVPGYWRSPGGSWFPTSAPARLGFVLVAVLTIAIVATAVGGLLTRLPGLIVEPSLSPPPSPVVSAAPSPSEPSASPSRPPTPTPSVGLPARAGMFADLTDFLVASDKVGWVLTRSALYRTTDTGTSWVEIRPPGSSPAAATALIDADTVYVASGGSPATIAATHDGGASWTETSLDVGAINGGPVFAFESSSKGYATFYDPNGTNTLDVYATTDGGTTWTGPKHGKVPHLAASMDKLYGPMGGFLWQSGGKFDNKPFDNRFFLSADGAVTWTQYTFPVGALAPKDAMKEIGGIVREENGHILVAIGADGGRNPLPAAVYESGDDPASWRLVTALPEGFDLQFLSPTDWILFSGPLGRVRSTTDGGGHWHTVKSSTSLYDIYTQQFATASTGWATKECRAVAGVPCEGTGHAKVLFVTTDGGLTWTRIGD